LFARDGRVRCGTCRQVFDGLVQLTSLDALEAGVPPPLAETTEGEVPTKTIALSAADRAAPSHGFAPLNWPMVPEVPVVPVPPRTPHVAPSAASETAAARDRVEQPLARVRPAATALAHEPAPVPSSRRASWLWAAAASLAALALGAQMLYSLRSEIAAYVPRLKPVLVRLCEWAHCSVPPLQRPSALAIQASDLLILDKAKPHLVQLIVTLQNQSALEVAYPALDLVLNDRFEHAVARRVFLPAEYLRGADASKSVIAASVSTTVRIDLDVSELAAGGFQLLLIAVPQS
jgi:hypothetical protein